MKRSMAAILVLCFSAAAAAAWSDHDQLSWIAGSDEAWAAETAEAEELAAFLEAAKPGLAEALRGYEAWASANLKGYPALPAALAFDPAASGEALRASFLRSIRVHPGRPYRLFVQPAAGRPRSPSRADLEAGEVDPLRSPFPNGPFQALLPGERASALEIVAAASDEPDYGMDLGLYEDNGTAHGAAYGLGAQPYGNPALEYGSQAPLHMTFFHEDPLIALLAPFSAAGLGEYRISLFTALSRFAFSEGHPYWGWRFAGWALHYIQDLAMPYHARLMPGKGTFELLALNAFGSKADVDGAIVLLSNRHSILEDYQYRLLASYTGDGSTSPVFAALAGKPARGVDGAKPVAFRAFYAPDVIAAAAAGRADVTDALVASLFPAAWVSEPSIDYVSGAPAAGYDPLADLRSRAPLDAAAFEEYLAAVMADVGAYSRAYLDYVRAAANGGTPEAAGARQGLPYAGTAARARPLDPRGPTYAAAPVLLAAAVVLFVRRRRAARPTP